MAQAPVALRLERKIELPGVRGRIDHLSIDAQKQLLFVAALGNDSVEVVDLASGRRTHTITGLAEPQGLLALPGTNRLVVANARDGSLRFFDETSLRQLRSMALGDDADNVRLDPENGLVWVGYGKGALEAVDAADGRPVVTIKLPAHPESFQLEQHGPRAFVNLPDAKSIAVVDRRRGTVLAHWKTGTAAANFPMALDETDGRLFVVCRSPARLLVLDTGSGAAVAELPTVGDADDVFYDSAARRVYVSGGEGAVAVHRQIDRDHYEEAARLPTVRGARTSLFSPQFGRLYVAVRREGSTPAAVWVYEILR